MTLPVVDNPLKQAICDGITNWLKDRAPVTVQMAMTRADIMQLLDSIADSIGVEHVKPV